MDKFMEIARMNYYFTGLLIVMLTFSETFLSIDARFLLNVDSSSSLELICDMANSRFDGRSLSRNNSDVSLFEAGFV